MERLLKVFILAVIMPATLQSKEMQSLEAIAEGSNKFAIDFYQALKTGKTGNIICSPISAQIVLTLAYNGANGTTADEMAKVLHLPASKDQILDGHKALITSLQDPVLKLATRMFIANSFSIKPDFKSAATTYFLSDAEIKDFANNSDGSRVEINSWVEEKTNHKIKDLLPSGSITPITRVVLVNAIHFKANWASKFDPELTRDEPFYITPTESVNVPMMNLYRGKLRFKFSSKLQAKICELPYEGNEFAMILIVPEALDGLSDVESKLASLNLTKELSDLHETTVDLKLPKFKIEDTMDLTGKLQEMGMKRAFSDGADFSGIAGEALVIDKVIQKAFVEVNEEGTEAAAATAVMMNRCLRINPVVMCDRPFTFFIARRNIILFSARFSIPEEFETVNEIN